MRTEIPVRPERGGTFRPEALKTLDRKEMCAVLATRDREGRPYTSLVSFVFTGDLREVIFATPRKTRKYENLRSENQVALLIDNRVETGGDIMETEAVTIVGRAKALRRGGRRDRLEAVFLSKHPGLENFVRSPTTALVSVEVNECIHVSRFQKVSVWRPDEAKTGI